MITELKAGDYLALPSPSRAEKSLFVEAALKCGATSAQKGLYEYSCIGWALDKNLVDSASKNSRFSKQNFVRGVSLDYIRAILEEKKNAESKPTENPKTTIEKEITFKSKTELAQWLMANEGKKLNRTDNANAIYYNGGRVDGSPFRCKYSRVGKTFSMAHEAWDCRHFTYEAEVEWYENIPEGGVLCWVWDTHGTKYLTEVTAYQPEIHTAPFYGNCNWKYATPAKASELNFVS